MVRQLDGFQGERDRKCFVFRSIARL